MRLRHLGPCTEKALRHSFATHLLEAGSDIRTVPERLGRKDVTRTMIYMHVLKPGPAGGRSPADMLTRAGYGTTRLLDMAFELGARAGVGRGRRAVDLPDYG